MSNITITNIKTNDTLSVIVFTCCNKPLSMFIWVFFSYQECGIAFRMIYHWFTTDNPANWVLNVLSIFFLYTLKLFPDLLCLCVMFCRLCTAPPSQKHAKWIVWLGEMYEWVCVCDALKRLASYSGVLYVWIEMRCDPTTMCLLYRRLNKWFRISTLITL